MLCELCSNVTDIYRSKYKIKTLYDDRQRERQTDAISIDCYSKRLNGISERITRSLDPDTIGMHAHYDLPCAPIVLVEKFGPD